MFLSVITNCTNRKLVAPAPRLQASKLGRGSQEKLARNWSKRIQTTKPVVRAGDLYGGRAFREAENAAKSGGGSLWIVSAGLGLVSANTHVPSYGLTISPGSPDSLSDLVSGDHFCPQTWWKTVNRYKRPGSICKLVREHPSERFLLAISSRYLTLITDDLLTLRSSELNRIRLVGPPLSTPMPDELRQVLMPYDDRLESRRLGISGTRGDFAQRAARHFATEIWCKNPEAKSEEHASAVLQILSTVQSRTIPTRVKKTDLQIRALIRKHWQQLDGRSGKMLRFFRDGLLIACEQKRFSNLFNEVKTQKGR